eukprot:5761785-Pyramimonas_sp.AAC.1
MRGRRGPDPCPRPVFCPGCILASGMPLYRGTDSRRMKNMSGDARSCSLWATFAYWLPLVHLSAQMRL